MFRLDYVFIALALLCLTLKVQCNYLPVGSLILITEVNELNNEKQDSLDKEEPFKGQLTQAEGQAPEPLDIHLHTFKDLQFSLSPLNDQDKNNLKDLELKVQTFSLLNHFLNLFVQSQVNWESSPAGPTENQIQPINNNILYYPSNPNTHIEPQPQPDRDHEGRDRGHRDHGDRNGEGSRSPGSEDSKVCLVRQEIMRTCKNEIDSLCKGNHQGGLNFHKNPSFNNPFKQIHFSKAHSLSSFFKNKFYKPSHRQHDQTDHMQSFQNKKMGKGVKQCLIENIDNLSPDCKNTINLLPFRACQQDIQTKCFKNNNNDNNNHDNNHHNRDGRKGHGYIKSCLKYYQFLKVNNDNNNMDPSLFLNDQCSNSINFWDRKEKENNNNNIKMDEDEQMFSLCRADVQENCADNKNNYFDLSKCMQNKFRNDLISKPCKDAIIKRFKKHHPSHHDDSDVIPSLAPGSGLDNDDDKESFPADSIDENDSDSGSNNQKHNRRGMLIALFLSLAILGGFVMCGVCLCCYTIYKRRQLAVESVNLHLSAPTIATQNFIPLNHNLHGPVASAQSQVNDSQRFNYFQLADAQESPAIRR